MNYRLKTIEEMDACVFSSDMLYNDEERKHFKAMVERWARALNETENVAPPQQPEQEPVAWSVTYHGIHCNNMFSDQILAENELRRLDEECGSAARTIVPLYAAPPQCEWKGLTDEERDEICLGDEAIARAIEFKLREKNDG